MSPDLKPLFDIEVLVASPIGIDPGPNGRRFIPIIGGTVSGIHTGKVLPGGGDWQSLWPDGRMEIAAHYVLDIDGHGAVEIRSDGVRHGAPEVLAALGRGEIVDPSLYYFRTAIRFRTAAPGLVRLNAVLAVATGARAADRVRLGVFEIG